MVEVGVGNPCLVIEGEAAGGGGKVEMEIAFEVPSERVNGQEDARKEAALGSQSFDDGSGERWKSVEEVAIDPEERLQGFGKCPGDMLPDGVGEGVEGGFDPVVSGFFATGGTETGFAGMRGLDATATGGADPDMPAEERRSTDEQFEHIDDNRFADEIAMGQKEPPPVAVIEEDVSEFDSTADEFHNRRLYDLNAEESKKLLPVAGSLT
jgi:hypothetical protein